MNWIDDFIAARKCIVFCDNEERLQWCDYHGVEEIQTSDGVIVIGADDLHYIYLCRDGVAAHALAFRDVSNQS